MDAATLVVLLMNGELLTSDKQHHHLKGLVRELPRGFAQ